ncbi:hypothetical protein SAMN05428942_7303 [Streptomyces sp. 2112.2]|nr:hypothetical protein SAMN05428942_7303 [Streptomyces sp. 2112.2]
MSDHYQPQQCTECGGQKGHTETTFDSNGVRHDTWRSCSPCGGTGVR